MLITEFNIVEHSVIWKAQEHSLTYSWMKEWMSADFNLWCIEHAFKFFFFATVHINQNCLDFQKCHMTFLTGMGSIGNGFTLIPTDLIKSDHIRVNNWTHFAWITFHRKVWQFFKFLWINPFLKRSPWVALFHNFTWLESHMNLWINFSSNFVDEFLQNVWNSWISVLIFFSPIGIHHTVSFP